MNITSGNIFAKLPIEQIKKTIYQHLEPLVPLMPDKRMERVAEQIILGILGGQTPVITEMERQSSKDKGETWAQPSGFIAGWATNASKANSFSQVYT